jgi:uncharacterized protein YbjT (DUF2867 family)
MILVCGAGGELGGRVARGLRAAGAQVRALVRPRSGTAGLAGVGIEIAEGDFRDPESLKRAVAGVETVVSTVTAISRALSGDRDAGLRRVDLQGPEALTRKQAVAVFERALGEPIKRRHVPRAALRAGTVGLRRARPAVASVMGIALGADLHPATWDDRPLRELGIAPRTVEAYAAEVTLQTPG